LGFLFQQDGGGEWALAVGEWEQEPSTE
jgi:hypothetical protein